MPKQRIVESRYDFSGGLNTAASPDTLQPNELRQLQNARVSGELRAIEKRGGTQYTEAASISSGKAVLGVYQWDAPAGPQWVCITEDGKFHHKTTLLGAWTTVGSPTPFAMAGTHYPVHFATFRGDGSGAALKLYIACQLSATTGVYAQWDGTTLSVLSGSSLPSQPSFCVAYHTRMFLGDVLYPKHLFWTDVGDATAADGTGITGGGSAIVDTLSGDRLLGGMQLGSSLALFTNDSILRFTGYSNEDIQVQQDTEGIASDIGAVGGRAWAKVDDFGVVLSERGPYLLSESGVKFIGAKIQNKFDAGKRSLLANAPVGYHKGRREIWVGMPVTANTEAPDEFWVYSLQLDCWMGPFDFGVEVRDLTRLEDANGDEYLLGAVGERTMVLDTDLKKDGVASAGTGGSAFMHIIEFGPFYSPAGPMQVAHWKHAFVQWKNTAAAGTLYLTFLNERLSSAEAASPTNLSGLTSGRIATGRFDFPTDALNVNTVCRRLRVFLYDQGAADTGNVIVYGLQLVGYDMQRLST